jgi:uncharacterized protein YndB with AHSA1/START domain
MMAPVAKSEVRESIVINADPVAVWKLVSDPTNYPRWSPEASKARRVSGSGKWRVGDRFVGTNKTWVPWSTACTVVTADGTEFAFDVNAGPFPVARWGYSVTPHPDGGCTVEETWVDRRSGIAGALVKPAAVLAGRGWDAAAHNAQTMRATLVALRDEAERTSHG